MLILTRRELTPFSGEFTPMARSAVVADSAPAKAVEWPEPITARALGRTAPVEPAVRRPFAEAPSLRP
ncbi:hypothetical protein [Streptomyces sp. NPDC058475]|uniref:hypothetical protein n=1 Tax=Streptomyces sp. NPDC058475 TaxID=3346518 RepID=UPI00366548B3